MPSEMERPRVNLLPNSDADNDIVEVNDSCVFKYEFENERNNECPEQYNPKGNLRKHIAFWKGIETSQFILNVFAEGYRLPFIYIPQPAIFANNQSTRKHHEFVTEAIVELLSSGRVIQTRSKPRVINLLSVSVQSTGKKRLILDLRYVNKCLEKRKIKYEDWKIAMLYFERDAYMFLFDLKSGYHHVEIFSEHQTFLGFSWKPSDSTQEKYYVFT